MKFVIATILLAACAAVQGRSLQAHPMISMADHHVDDRVIDGTDAPKGLLPWQAALIITGPNGKSLCGGSLIREDIVLTAAHCLYNAQTVEVHLGGVDLWSDMEYNQVAFKFMYHENYNPQTFENDVALIELPIPATQSPNVLVIPLAARSQPDLVGSTVRLSGYGKRLDGEVSTTLQWVDLTVVTNEVCAKYFPSLVFPSTICVHGAPHHNACQGDSGGPLVHYELHPVLVGVVSFGNTARCAGGYPSGYARVSSYLDWIHDNTGIEISD